MNSQEEINSGLTSSLNQVNLDLRVVIQSHNQLVGDHNDLVTNHNNLVKASQIMLQQINDLALIVQALESELRGCDNSKPEAE